MENTLCLQYTALATLLLPFIGALLTACVPQRMAKWICTLFALLATLGTVIIGLLFLAHGKADTTITLLQYGNVALFGFIIDRISTLIVFAVVFLACWSACIPPVTSPRPTANIPMRAATAITLSC